MAVEKQTFAELLQETEEMEKTAISMQSSRPGGFTTEQIRCFRIQYETWYAKGLALLPDDLRSGFEKEYEGGRFTQKISVFLAEPTRPNIIFSKAVDDNNLTLNDLYWQCPVSTCFLKPFIQQQSLLRQADARILMANDAQLRSDGETNQIEVGVVFIAHGRSLLYLDVYRYLREELGLIAESFESEDHTAEQISEVLDRYLGRSIAAIIVMTGEDMTIDNEPRARQNVVHEAGLFQGKLGFDKVAILKPKGVESFTNMNGLIYIPFDPDDMPSCFYRLRRFLAKQGMVA